MLELFQNTLGQKISIKLLNAFADLQRKTFLSLELKEIGSRDLRKTASKHIFYNM